MNLIAGRYAINDPKLDLLGRGGMGDVFRATDTQTGQSVAIKALKPNVVAGQPEMVARFVQEGEMLRRLNHPNIVQMLAAVEESEQHYLVMEYVSGGSLQELLEQKKRLSLRDTLRIALELADALTRAHHLHVIHRDLKPGNVLLAGDSTPRLTDFGVAQLGGTSNLTEVGMMVGTIDYLSPEACQGETLDGRTDIWAFGVLLFEMLTGHRPFRGSGVGATITAILTQPIPDLALIRPDIPDALADLIYRMLEKDRHQRIPSVRLVGAGLEAILEQIGGDRERPEGGRFETPQSVAVSTSSAGYFSFRAATPTRHNLPAQATPFVGRETELETLGQLLNDPTARLITILGPGGMGKTRLSLAAAAAHLETKSTAPLFRHGLYFVPLAPLRSAEHIVAAMAEAVDLFFQAGNPEKQQLLDYLRQKEMLLILDNFEHVLAGATLVSDILKLAPGVKILATSRERLNLQEEQIFQVQGLDFPDWETPEDAARYAAVRLFLQSARRVQPNFELSPADLAPLTRICRQVRGMPLAIILAAAWVEMLTPAEIAAEVSQNLDFLATEMRDTPERQRSLRAVFDYSWNLLNQREQEIFCRLSVFRGGFSRPAGQEIGGASLRDLMALVNKSLLHRFPTGRYDVHEVLRQYAAEKLAQSPEGDAPVRDRATTYYAAALERRADDLLGPRELEALDDIESDSENVRAAWYWAVAQGQVARLAQMVDGLAGFYLQRGRYQEGEAACQAAAASLVKQANPEATHLLARLWTRQSLFARVLGRPTEGGQLLDQALALLDDPALAAVDTRPARAFILQQRGMSLTNIGQREAGQQVFQEHLALRRELGDDWGIALGLWSLSYVEWLMGNYDTAWSLAAESLELRQKIGARSGIADALTVLAGTAIYRGDFELAEQYLRQNITIRQEMGDQAGLAMSLGNLGAVALWMGRLEEACALREEGLRILTDLGIRLNIAHSTIQVAHARLHLGQYELAASLADTALAQAQEANYQRGVGLAYWLQGSAALVNGQEARARELLLQAIEVLGTIQQREEQATALPLLSLVEYRLGNATAARQYLARGLQTAVEIRAITSLGGNLTIATLLLADRGELEAAAELYALVAHRSYVGKSQFFADFVAKPLQEMTAALPPAVLAAAQERGRQQELWPAATAVLAVLTTP